MSQETIYQNGTAEVNVPATESIAISNYGGGIAKIYYHIITANTPPAWQFQQTLENSAVILGPFTVATIVKIDANNSKVFYDIGSSPDTGIGDADTLNGKASDTASTADTIVARDSSGNITGNVLISDVAIGTAPLTVTSTTVVPNLNADTVDGIQGSNIAKLDAANTFTGVNQFNIIKTPDTVTVNETADYLGEFRINASTASSGGDRIPLVFNVGSNTSPNISAVIEAGREAAGWNTYLAFYTNNITSGPESTDAIQEKMRLSGDGVLTVTGETVYHTGNDTNLAKLDADNAFTGTNNYFQNYINIGKNSGGDSIAYFYDDTGNVYRSFRFEATGQKWQLTDSTGTLRDIYHAGNDTNLAKLDAANTFSNILSVASISPQIKLDETDTTTKAVFNQDGGELYIQVSSTGYVGGGTLRITGTNNTDIGSVTIRTGSINHSVYHAGINPSLGSGNAITGSFTTSDAKTITVTDGIITAIV